MSEVTDWLPTAAGNAIAFDDIDNRDGVARAKVKTNFRAIMAAVKRNSQSGGSTLNLKSNGATGDGATDDTTNLQAAITAAPAGSAISSPTGVFKHNGVTFTKAMTLTGSEASSFKAAADGTILARIPGDPSTTGGFPSARDNAPGYRILGMDFDGNGADFYTFRPGTVGIKFGDSTASPIQCASRDNFLHGLETGKWLYGAQEYDSLHDKAYRCKWGLLIQGDPTNGGGTASIQQMDTTQLCHVGIVIDNIGQRAIATTATLANSSTAVTAVADLTGVAVGDDVNGRGIKAGTTVAALPGGGAVTLSQSTTASAAMTKAPLLFSNGYGPGRGYGMQWTFVGQTVQGSGVAAAAIYGAEVNFNTCHFEANNQPAVATGTSTNTRSARVIPNRPFTLSNAVARFVTCSINETIQSAFSVTDGSRVEFIDTQVTGDILGDYMSSVAYYGYPGNLSGQVFPPVARWPDVFASRSAGGWCALGDPTQVQSAVIPNSYAEINPRVPLLNATGPATVSYIVDPALGPCAKTQFSTAVGGLGSHSVDSEFFTAGIAVGDWLLFSRLIRADSYTTLRFWGNNGGTAYGYYAVPVAPFVQRLVIALRAGTADTGVRMNMFPVGTDGPAVYIAREMQAKAPDSDVQARAALSAVLRDGLFNDSTTDGSLRGKATIDLASVAATSNGTPQTITVRGAVIGNRVTVDPSIDGQGMTFPARVTAANTVTFIPSNPTAAAIDLASADFIARVLP